MKSKDRLQIQLKGIYVIYILILLIGVIGTVTSNSFNQGYIAARNDVDLALHQAFVELKDGESQSYEYNSEGVRLEVKGVDIFVNKDDLPNEYKRQMSSIKYDLIMLFYILFGSAVFILIAKIINKIRFSIKGGEPINQKAINYTRIVGLLMMLMVLCEWIYSVFSLRAVNMLLANTKYIAVYDMSFNFWLLMCGLMMILMAQIISIARDLGQEQEFTI